MKQVIVAGDFKDTIDLLKGWSDKLFKLFDDLINSEGYKFETSKETDNGGVEYKVTAANGAFTFKLTLTPTKNRAGYFDMEIDTEDGQPPLVSKNIAEAQVEKELKDQLSNFSDVHIEESTKIRMTLHKITAGTDIDVELSGIAAPDYVKAFGLLDEALQSDEFVASLPEEPTSFEMSADDEGIDIILCDSCPSLLADKLNACISCTYSMIAGFKTIHWYARGADFRELHELADSLAEKAYQDMDTLGEISMELCLCSDGFAHPSQYLPVSTLSGIYKLAGMQHMSCWIHEYICMLEALYVDLPHDKQSILDGIIEEWKKQADYFLQRTLN